MHGIQRPPALFCSEHCNSDMLTIYEVPACEPLHDISNVVQNLITELPSHIENKKAQQEFEKFSEVTIGDKKQLKGSDARLYAVKTGKIRGHTAFRRKNPKRYSKHVHLTCTCRNHFDLLQSTQPKNPKESS